VIRNRWLVVVVAVLALCAPLTGVAAGLSSPDTTSTDLDIVFIDFNQNLKYVDAGGSVTDTGVQAEAVGGAGDFDGDGDVDVAYRTTAGDLAIIDAGGNTQTIVGNTGDVGAMVDFDDDGSQEILHIDASDGEIDAIDNAGDRVGIFIKADRVGGAGDLDDDGQMEVVVEDAGTLYSINADSSTSDLGKANDVGGVIDLDDDGDLNVVHNDEYYNLRITASDASTTDLGVDTGSDRDVGGAGDLDADGNEEAAYIDDVDNTINYIGSSGGATDLGVSAMDVGAVVDFDDDGDYQDAPTVSNPSPDSTTVSTDPVTLSVDVDDSEFVLGDSVTVNIDHNGNDVTQTTISSAQTITADVQDVDDGSNSWSVTVTDSEGNSNSYSYSYTADYAPPSLSNAQPTGDLTSYDGTITIDVSDPDFSQGDSVTVSATDSDGKQIGTDTVSSNTTVSFEYDGVTSGTNEIDWTATDSHGNTDTYNQSFDAPDQLTVYNESDPDQEITGANLTAKFYFRTADPQIITRNASGGSVSLGGVPANEPFVVVVEADGYISRRVVFSSLINQQSVFLLPENKTKTEVVFEIEDYTGSYPQESTALLVQRGLNGTWQTVAGDYFGATGEFPAQLRYQARHRLVLVNLDTGQRRVAGSYTPLRASTQTISVTTQGEIDVSGRGLDVSVAPGTRTLTNTSGETITVEIEENDATLRNATIKAVFRDANRSSSTVLTTQNVSSPGEYQLSIDLGNRAGGSVDVVVDYETDGLSTSEVVTYTIRRAFENDHSLLAVLASVAPRFPAGHVDAFQSVVVLFATVLGAAATASQFRASTELVGLVAVVILGGFAVISWIDYGVVFVAGVTWVALAGLRRGL
jgi:hypothetical protein